MHQRQSRRCSLHRGARRSPTRYVVFVAGFLLRCSATRSRTLRVGQATASIETAQLKKLKAQLRQLQAGGAQKANAGDDAGPGPGKGPGKGPGRNGPGGAHKKKKK